MERRVEEIQRGNENGRRRWKRKKGERAVDEKRKGREKDGER